MNRWCQIRQTTHPRWNLAFEQELVTDQAKIGILVASTVAALVGATILRFSRSADGPAPGA